MRLRVDELALQADVAVDTIRQYEAQGLLAIAARDGDGRGGGDEATRHEAAGGEPVYTEDHLERIARLKDLQRRGFTVPMIRRFLAGELDPADEQLAEAVAEAGDRDGGGEELFDMAELERRAGVPEPVLDSLVREGLLVPRVHDGQARFTAGDADMVKGGLRLVEAGLPLPELFALARHHHEVTRGVAVQAVELFDTYVRKPLRASALAEDEKAARMVDAFQTVMPAVTSLVSHHFRRILLQVAQEHFESDGDGVAK